MRGLIRRTPLSQISDLQGQTTDDLRLAIDEVVASHGVTIRRVSITAARPPEDFLRSEEARQLAILQRSAQTELQALALQRQLPQARLIDAHSLLELRMKPERLWPQIEAFLLDLVADGQPRRTRRRRG